MRQTAVHVCDDGTVNGHVAHRMCAPSKRGGGYRLSFDSAGKCHTKHAHLPQIPGFTAGQDAFTYTDHCIAVSDGHGPRGHLVSRALLRGPTSVLDVLDTRQWEARLGACESPWRVADAIRQRVCAHLAGVTEADSGATLAVMLFLTSGSRRWAVTINVGDSEALIVSKHGVHTCSVEHNWDNAALYKRYVRDCRARGVSLAPVCYNRWNDRTGKYRLGKHLKPILMYDDDEVDVTNARYVSSMFCTKPKWRYGTQSIRTDVAPHENWGACVLLKGKARGQSMATFGDRRQRVQTHVPMDMCHVYIHEIPRGQAVVALVQTDGVSNGLTRAACGQSAVLPAAAYLERVRKVSDDMCVCIARWSPV